MRIGMIVAMEREVEALLLRVGKPINVDSFGGYEVKIYAVGDNELYVVRSGAGEIYAAGATQMLITKYDVKMIVNFGICGGLTEDMALCRAVVVEKVVHYDFDTSPVDNCEPARYLSYPDIYIPTSEELVKAAIEAEPTLERVICASGDKFIADPEKKRELNRLYGAKICEMEAAGILLTADRAGVPVLMIKAVSDSVSGGADEFTVMVSEAADSCVRAMLTALGKL